MFNKLKIVVGLSGGVDSAVTALLLKQQGHEVTAIYMQNWDADPNDPHCTAEQDLSDARAVADQIGIPLYTVNFAEEYWNKVFQHCLDEFARGRTPNPDIGCNREIKFKVFLEHAIKLGADKLATGHYARIENSNPIKLLKGLDPNKDQSYFLYTLGQHELQKSLFPVGALEKTAVRRLAAEYGLINSTKKDSTGVCFIGERKFKQFLQEFLIAQPGNLETTEGQIIGKHDGVMFYTLGQRQGLKIGGVKNYPEEPWYVLSKDVKRNVLIVGQGENHPLLYRSQLSAENLHWISGETPTLPLQCEAKIRYRQQSQLCRVTNGDNDTVTVEFSEPQRAVTPGQSVVFYQDEVCLGGGVIQ